MSQIINNRHIRIVTVQEDYVADKCNDGNNHFCKYLEMGPRCLMFRNSYPVPKEKTIEPCAACLAATVKEK